MLEMGVTFSYTFIPFYTLGYPLGLFGFNNWARVICIIRKRDNALLSILRNKCFRLSFSFSFPSLLARIGMFQGSCCSHYIWYIFVVQSRPVCCWALIGILDLYPRVDSGNPLPRRGGKKHLQKLPYVPFCRLKGKQNHPYWATTVLLWTPSLKGIW